MNLTLDREDLKPEFHDINCSRTRLEHFKPEVQAAVIQAGGAQFREYDGSNYNAILVTENIISGDDKEPCPIHGHEYTGLCSLCVSVSGVGLFS